MYIYVNSFYITGEGAYVLLIQSALKRNNESTIYIIFSETESKEYTVSEIYQSHFVFGVDSKN